MEKKSLLFVLFIIGTSALFAQSFSGKIIDSITQKPIPFATIQTDEATGVISNEDGYFSIHLPKGDQTKLNISCMGYGSKELLISSIKAQQNIIVLSEHVNALSTVFLSNKALSIDSIMARTNRNLKVNYSPFMKKYGVFSRSTNYMDFKKLDIDIDKASGMRKSKLEGVNYSLDSLSKAVRNSKYIQFLDFAGGYSVLNAKDRKLKVNKVTVLVDKDKDFSIDNVQKKAQDIVLRYLDTTQTYKLKSGLFKVEDSLSFGDLKSDRKENEISLGSLKGNINLRDTYMLEGTFIPELLDQKYYDHELLDVSFYQNDMVYVVKFTPRKSSAKYAGTLYIASESYAVLRTDYEYAEGKRGSKLNLRLLLGVKFIENVHKGTILFEKAKDSTYQPKYVFEESGQYVYVHRPLKFIENSDDKNKVAFDLLLEGNAREKRELLLYDIAAITSGDFEALTEVKNVEFQHLKQYDTSIWQQYNALEPLEEMKQFKTVE